MESNYFHLVVVALILLLQSFPIISLVIHSNLWKKSIRNKKNIGGIQNNLLLLRSGTHFGIIFYFRFSSTSTQCYYGSIFESECYHLTTFARRQKRFSIALASIDTSCKIPNGRYWELAATNASWVLKILMNDLIATIHLNFHLTFDDIYRIWCLLKVSDPLEYFYNYIRFIT